MEREKVGEDGWNRPKCPNFISFLSGFGQETGVGLENAL